MAEAPRVSIVIPSFNQGRFLDQCLDSIFRQRHRPLEVLVLDGGSTDETVSVLERWAKDYPELRWWSERDKGPADAVNKGFSRLHGEIVGIQGADDYYLGEAIEEAVRVFQQNDRIGLVYGDSLSADQNGRPRGAGWCRPSHDNALCIGLGICIPQSSAFFRSHLLPELKGWDARYHTCDWEFWLRMMFRTEVRKVDGYWSVWRVYAGQRTDQRQKVYQSFVRMIDESTDLAAASPEHRRAASAAKHLMGISFGTHRGMRQRASCLFKAVLTYPRIWQHIPQRHRHIPGLHRLVPWLRRTFSTPPEPTPELK